MVVAVVVVVEVVVVVVVVGVLVVERRLVIVVGGAAVVDATGIGEDSGCSPIVASRSFTFGRIIAVALVAANGFAAAL